MILPKNTRAQEAAPHDEQRGQKTHENPLQPGPACHNQFIKDPLAHFLAIPWTAKLLTDPAVLHVVVPDRNPLASRDKQLVRSILNGETTVRACVAFFVGPRSGEQQGDGEGSKTTPLPRYHAVADLGEDLCGHRGTLHGAATVLLLDETMCGAVDHQSGEPLGPSSVGGLCLAWIWSADLVGANETRRYIHRDDDDEVLEASQAAGHRACHGDSDQERRAQVPCERLNRGQ